MATCLDDPIYLALRNERIIASSVDPPPGWGEDDEGN